MNGSALASLIAGFGTGYLSGKDKAEDRKRQAAMDQIILDRAAREKESWDAQKAQQQQIAQAAAPVVAQAGTQVTDSTGNQNFAAQQGDAAWLQQQSRAQADLQGADASPNAGASMARYGVTTAEGRPIITDQATAQATADAANTPDAQLQRVSKVLMGYDPTRAIQLQQQGVQTKLAQANLDQAQQQELARKQQAEIVTAYTRGGRAAIPQIYSRYNDGLSAKVDDQGANGFTVTTFDKDGKQVGAQSFKNDLEFLGHTVLSAGYDPTKWLGFEQQQQQERNQSERWNKEFDQRGAFHQDDVRMQQQRLGMEGASIGLRRDEVQLARQAAQQKADAAVALYQEQHPNATPAQLAAVRTGVMAAIPWTDTNAPAQVKLAKAMVEAGLAPNMQVALQRAMQSGEKSPDAIKAELYKAALSNPLTASNPEAAVTKAMQFLGSGSPQPGAAPGSGGRTPISQFKPGQIYTDANGNRAQLVNGVLVPVK